MEALNLKVGDIFLATKPGRYWQFAKDVIVDPVSPEPIYTKAPVGYRMIITAVNDNGFSYRSQIRRAPHDDWEDLAEKTVAGFTLLQQEIAAGWLALEITRDFGLSRAPCNYCMYQGFLAHAKNIGEEVTLLANRTYELGGFDVYIHLAEVRLTELSEVERKQYWVAWFMGLSDHCVC